MKARDTLEATRAFGQMRKSFFNECLKARFLNGPDKTVGTAYEVFEGEALQRLVEHINIPALHTPVVLTDNLSNRLLAGHISFQDGFHMIAVNVRFKVDAEILLHTLAEEFAHAQQVTDGVDFAAQRQQHPYAQRPYEIQVRQIATVILGYVPGNYEAILWRAEPLSGLYDAQP